MIRAHDLGIGSVLADVSFELPDHGCLGVIGLNGAGKSTLLALLAGVLTPDTGSASVPPGAAYLPEGCPLDPGVSVAAWLRLAAHLPGYDADRAEALAASLPLPASHRGRLSQGQRVRLGLRMTLPRRAPAYLLDDPFLGLDPVARRAAEAAIAERSADAPIVIATQDTAAVERLCTHLLLLRAGRPVWFAELDDWQARYRAVRVSGERADDLAALGASVLSSTPRGATLDVVLDDPSGALSASLQGERRPLPLAELIAEVP